MTQQQLKLVSTFQATGNPSSVQLLPFSIGTDEKAIINVLAYRSNQQRQDVKNKFKALYGKV
jgi:hypothetical protein